MSKLHIFEITIPLGAFLMFLGMFIQSKSEIACILLLSIGMGIIFGAIAGVFFRGIWNE